VLEEHDPDAVPPGLEAEAFVLAASARFHKGEFEAFHGVWADVQSTLRFVDNLYLLAARATAIDEDLRFLHICFFKDVRCGLLDIDVAKVRLAFISSIVDLSLAVAVGVLIGVVLLLRAKDQVRRSLLEDSATHALVLLLSMSDPSDPVKHLSLLLIVEGTEDETESNFTLAAHQLGFDKPDQALKQLWEGLEND